MNRGVFLAILSTDSYNRDESGLNLGTGLRERSCEPLAVVLEGR